MLILGSQGGSFAVLDEIASLFPKPQITDFYENGVAEQLIFETFGSNKIKISNNCNTKGMSCFEPAQKINVCTTI